tara:strand:- start:856 stop:1542 length:687 start_codon:yes stop_codon:yes gene_type:complete
MTTQLVKDLVEAKRLGRKLDLPSTIENITDKLEFGEKVCVQGLRNNIFILRNCCAPYSMTVYERIMDVFGVYETLFSMEKFKNEKKVKHYRKIKETISTIFGDIGFPEKAGQIWRDTWYWKSDKCVKRIFECFTDPTRNALCDAYVNPCFLKKLPGFGTKTVAKIVFTMEYKDEVLPDIQKIIFNNTRQEIEKEKKFKLLVKQLENTEMILKIKNLELKTGVVNSVLE